MHVWYEAHHSSERQLQWLCEWQKKGIGKVVGDKRFALWWWWLLLLLLSVVL